MIAVHSTLQVKEILTKFNVSEPDKPSNISDLVPNNFFLLSKFNNCWEHNF